jgi:hypothetical protein
MYDPIYSRSFVAADHSDNPDWAAVLAAAAQLMDDDIREQLHDRDFSGYQCPDLEFLLVYMDAHETKFGSHFEWV